MQPILLLHITAGGAALIAGLLALSVTKGARAHRKSGLLFVCSMIAMGLSGAWMAASTGVLTSVASGTLTAYLVVTGLTTVRPPASGARWLDLGGMLVAFAVGLAYVGLALQTIADGEFVRDGAPLPMLVVFAGTSLLAGAGDLRVLRSGGLRGRRRLARHLWRMCFALFIASGSFFLGQADEFPEALRNLPLLAIPALLPLPVMAYWLWRVRARRGLTPRPQRLRRLEGERLAGRELEVSPFDAVL